MTRFLVVVCLAAISHAQAADRVALTGTVNGPDRRPLAGATVIIRTAGPRYGTSPLCPSCYADCGKRALSDAEGRFTIDDLDPDLTFSVVAWAEGHRAGIVSRTDPSDGRTHIFLEKLPADPPGARQFIRGRILGPAGVPVLGAVVEPHGVETDQGQRYDNLRSQGIDELAVTDEHGQFILTSTTEFKSLDLQVSAPGLATRYLPQVPPGPIADIHLDRGAAVAGQLKSGDRPLAGIVVGAVQVDRSIGVFVGERTSVTDREGRFQIENLPAGHLVYVYTKMQSMGARGAAPIHKVETGGADSITDIGEWRTEPAHRVAGRVTLSDGQPIPADTSLLLSRSSAWDSLVLPLDADGGFSAVGVPTGPLSVHVRVPGYRLSSRNGSIDAYGFSLAGTVARDIDSLTVLLEPEGAEIQPQAYSGSREQRMAWVNQWSRNKRPGRGPDSPLRGAEAADSREPVGEGDGYVIRGRVERADGSGAPGVDVFLLVYSNDEQSNSRSDIWQSLIFQMQPEQLAIQTFVAKLEWAISDAQGRFEFAQVPADHRVDLFYTGEGVPQSTRRSVDRLPSADRQSLILRASRPAVLKGRINRQSYPDATGLQLWNPDRSVQHLEIKVAADQDTFEFKDVSAGEYQVLVKGASVEVGRRSVGGGPISYHPIVGRYPATVAEGQVVERDLGFEPQFSVTGQLVVAGEPFVNGAVALFAPDDRVERWSRTDARGYVQFQAVQPGKYRLIPIEGQAQDTEASLHRPKRFVEVAVSDENIDREFAFPPFAEVRGTLKQVPWRQLLIRSVRLDVAGEPVYGMFKPTSEDPNQFSFGELLPGTYALLAQNTQGYVLLRSDVVVAGDKPVVELGEVRCEFGKVKFEFDGLDTAPADRWFKVEMRRPIREEKELDPIRLLEAKVTGSTMEFNTVAAGPVEILIPAMSYAADPGSVSLDVKEGSERVVRVVMRPVTGLLLHSSMHLRRLTIVSARLERDGGAGIIELDRAARRPDLTQPRFSAFLDSSVWVKGVDAGRWTVKVRLSDGREMSWPVELVAGRYVEIMQDFRAP